jgi:hypothetical protein
MPIHKEFQHNEEMAELLPACVFEEGRIENLSSTLKRVAKAPMQAAFPQAAFPPRMCGMSVIE